MIDNKILFSPQPDLDIDSAINSVHTLSTDIAIIQLSLDGYGTDNIFTYIHIDLQQNLTTQFDITSGVNLSTFESPHRHGYFELLLVLEGSLYIVMEGNRVHYGRGDLCLLNRNTKHHEEFRGDFKIKYFCFSQDFLQSLPMSFGSSTCPLTIPRFFRQNLDDNSSKTKDYMDFFINEEDAPSLEAEKIWDEIRKELSDKDAGYELFIKGWINRLFSLLENKNIYHFEQKNLGLLSEKNITDEVMYYINSVKRKITREELAGVLSYNGDYMNRIFKKQTGRSILDYCHTVCMEEAGRLLATTGLDIQNIVKLLGYENRTHFNRLFKEYFQMTPGVYRMQHQMLGLPR